MWYSWHVLSRPYHLRAGVERRDRHRRLPRLNRARTPIPGGNGCSRRGPRLIYPPLNTAGIALPRCWVTGPTAAACGSSGSSQLNRGRAASPHPPPPPRHVRSVAARQRSRRPRPEKTHCIPWQGPARRHQAPHSPPPHKPLNPTLAFFNFLFFKNNGN